ncbi:acyltransferase family protein [Mesorhizobium marinum]|uniref:acyltransferase family protein n=1 Tax=Mesorhizobium marinum TaxID=3228790 RepID=UPI003465E3FE
MDWVNYRPDIDGLRAVAVLAVVLFHAAPSLAPGGFVGVDIFYVISGFLITGLIRREIDAGTYSTLNFYERRFRRIAPAFLVVCAISTVAAALLYIPGHFELYGKSLIASILIHANNFFYHEAGYFAAPDEVTPLLHIWSLSVEEQFYVAFPIAMVLLTTRRSLRTTIILAALALSFLASSYAVFADADAAFYLASFRAWELLVGSILALGVIPVVKGRAAAACSWIAGMLIAVAIWNLSSTSIFPGFTALIPCIGAALFIHAGQQAPVNRGLSLQPIVGVGLISYSLYLWHWPLLSFGTYVAMGPLSAVDATLVVAVSFLAAVASYRYVERPFRRPARRLGLSPLIAGLSALLAVAAVADLTEGAPWRLPESVVALTDDQSMRIGMPAESCRAHTLSDADLQLVISTWMAICSIGDSTAAPTVLLWGDSHARAAAPALDAVLKEQGLAGYVLTRGGCPPLINLERLDNEEKHCSVSADAALQIISSINPSLIILAARWAHYVEGATVGQENGRSPLYAPDGNVGAVTFALDETMDRLSDLAAIVIMESVPEIGVHVPSMLARFALFERQVDIAPTRQEYATRQNRASTILGKAAAEHRASIMHPADYLCDSLNCLVELNGHSLYADSNHVSRAGVALLIPMFSAAVRTWANDAGPGRLAVEAVQTR